MKRFIFLLCGLAALGLGIYFLVSSSGLAKRCTVPIKATIVNVVKETETDSDGFSQDAYFPVIEYTVDGKTVSKKVNKSSYSPSEFKKDDTMNVLYNPDNVEEFIIEGDNGATIGGIVFICFGVIFCFVGIKQLLLGR